jgi:hypothetical protein
VTEHAQRFYFGLVDATMEEASRLSAPDEDVTGPNRTLWRELSANFVLNLDECNSQASQGSSFIVGDSKIRKHEKNETSSRVSITTVECGNAAGNDGPSMYLMAGEQMPGHFEELYGSSSFLRTSGAPRNSFVVMTPSAFMTNKAWDGAAEKLAKGIRAMPVIVDYPEFWLVLHLDGYKSHVMTYPAQAIFRRLATVSSWSRRTRTPRKLTRLMIKNLRRKAKARTAAGNNTHAPAPTHTHTHTHTSALRARTHTHTHTPATNTHTHTHSSPRTTHTHQHTIM